MKIALYYLASPKTGGWVTYIIHLMACLRKVGYEPVLFKLGNKTQKQFRPLTESVNYKTISLGDADKINKKIPYIIVAMELKDEAIEQAVHMLNKRPGIVIHHGCGQTPNKDFFEKIPENIPHIAVRDSIKAKINDFGYECEFILHPYISSPKENSGRFRAASISRVDYVKNTHIIVESNKFLKSKIHIHGSENRLYTFQKINLIDDKWKDAYFGEFSPESSRDIASTYEVIVDLTRIKNDGGGLQYTFLEAIDCDCLLILHDDWVSGEGSLFKDNLNCKTIKNSNELTALINSKEDFSGLIKKSKELLKLHSPIKIAKEFKAIVERVSP